MWISDNNRVAQTVGSALPEPLFFLNKGVFYCSGFTPEELTQFTTITRDTVILKDLWAAHTALVFTAAGWHVKTLMKWEFNEQSERFGFYTERKTFVFSRKHSTGHDSYGQYNFSVFICIVGDTSPGPHNISHLSLSTQLSSIWTQDTDIMVLLHI